MFSEEVYQKEWSDSRRKTLGNCDPGLLQKSVYALTLLGHLSQSDLPFLFKGGTSMLLHLPEIQRLSIDIDIVCPASDEELDQVIAEIGNKDPFLRVEEDKRGGGGTRELPQRRHFKFFFNTPYGRTGQDYVILDVVQEEEIPHETAKLPIRTSFLEPSEERLVELPTIDSLLADKLTAFAPTTTGVRIRREDGTPGEIMQVAKQLFDVGTLFDHATDFAQIARVYDTVQSQESGYRDQKHSKEQTLADTLSACLCYCAIKPKNQTAFADLPLLKSGMSRLKGHLTIAKLTEQHQKALAAKTALLAARLQAGSTFDFSSQRYSGTKEQLNSIKTATVADADYLWADSLKGTFTESYYYLLRTLDPSL